LAGFFATVVVVNGLALSRWQVRRYHRELARRVEELLPRLKPGSRVVTVKDSIKLLPRDFPLEISSRGLVVAEAVTPGLADAPRWREAFRRLVKEAWKARGDVWVSRRLLGEAPPASGSWVEGDDPRVSWAEIHGFFSHLDLGEAVGGENGFVRLLPSAKTRKALDASGKRRNR
jgi:hypothetical protein